MRYFPEDNIRRTEILQRTERSENDKCTFIVHGKLRRVAHMKFPRYARGFDPRSPRDRPLQRGKNKTENNPDTIAAGGWQTFDTGLDSCPIIIIVDVFTGGACFGPVQNTFRRDDFTYFFFFFPPPKMMEKERDYINPRRPSYSPTTGRY